VEYSYLNYSPKFIELREKLIYFMERYVFSNEMTFMHQIGQGENRWKINPPIMEELKVKAKA
jgi:acyl-CoA dehydrogenase